jgi:transposase InsO family protein
MSQDIGNTAQLESGGVEGPLGHYCCCRRRPGSPRDGAQLQGVAGLGERLVARYRVEGEAAFERRSRRPRTSRNAISASTVELIIRLRGELTRQGLDAAAHTIAWHLAEHHQLQVSVATIWRTLKRNGLIAPEPAKKPKAAYVRFAAEQPNEMWQVDFTHYRLIQPDGSSGADVEILSFLDDHSRYAISITCHQPVTGPAVVAVFRQAVADQGIPASVLSDNGMVFTTRFAGGRAGRHTLNGFQAELRQLRVIQKHSKPTLHPPGPEVRRPNGGSADAGVDGDDVLKVVGMVGVFLRATGQQRTQP